MVKNYISQHFPVGAEALTRYQEVVEIVSEDEVAVSLLEKLMESAERYFSTVVNMESRLTMARFRMEGDAFRDYAQTMDKNRRMAHEALISNLHIFNRYALKKFSGTMPVGGVFSKNPEAIRDRAAVGDWAGELLCALYTNRKR